MRLLNPYLEAFLALPAWCRSPAATAPPRFEPSSSDWYHFKAAVAGHFAWAVPTEQAIFEIAAYTDRVIEVGAGSGYWAWLLRQAGLNVKAVDSTPPLHTWTSVDRGDDRVVSAYPDHTLMLCWPPWSSPMAFDALSRTRGQHIIYIGEWMGGCAGPRFFSMLAAHYEIVKVVAIPQWVGRFDKLMVLRRSAV